MRNKLLILCDNRPLLCSSQILAFCENLEELALVGCDALFMTGSILSRDSALGVTLPSLRELDLSSNRYLSDAILVRLLALSPRLESLSLRGCQIGFHPGIYRRFYPAGGAGAVSSSVLTFECVLSFLREHGADLELDLSRCLTAVTDASLQAICRYMRGLQVLRISECHLVTDSGLTGLGLTPISDGAELKPNKTFLHGEAGAQPEQPAARATPRRNEHAISLRSRHEREIWSDAGRKVLVQSQIDLNETGSGVSLLDLKCLTELDLSQCSRISDVGVSHVVRFGGLRRLSLAHCPQLGDAGVARLGRHCPGLEVVRLAHCVALTDEGLAGLVRHAPRLKHLELQGCVELTDGALRAIMAHCASLQYLDVSGCRLMSAAQAGCLEEALPRLATWARPWTLPEGAVPTGPNVTDVPGFNAKSDSRLPCGAPGL
ncbi:F-box/LRR-repeat protein 2-like [Pollicipes pollicipes]|uniref:F-box/LRR-repeat protein 2-like n=1 Tax=Pollicipes pollicipes TaxID=41117 RepID=UPI00188523AC|nr:F-box/LRR-repeat protein 2-like [Pollicipes pollicipes]